MKTITAAAPFALLILGVACQDSPANSNDITTQTSTLTISSAVLYPTRSIFDTPPTYNIEIYRGDVLYEDLGYSEVGDFVVDLPQGMEFSVVAWADYDDLPESRATSYIVTGHFDSQNLNSVVLNESEYSVNSTSKDGFCGSQVVNLAENESIAMTLTRPMASINIYTSDMEYLTREEFRPTHVKVVYRNLRKSYDALHGTVLGDTDTLQTALTEVVNDNGYLLSDFVFVPSDGAVLNFDAYFYNSDGEEISSYNFTNISCKPNYKTNIYGNFFTTGITVNITVDDTWN